MLVRRATEKDLAAVMLFSEESDYAPRWSEDAWRKALANHGGHISLVAVDSGERVCGVVAAYWLLYETTVENIVVATRMQRQRVARRLMEALAKEVYVLNPEGVLELEVNERNVAAIALYRALGFAEQGRRKRYYGGVDDAVLMGLQLRDLARR